MVDANKHPGGIVFSIFPTNKPSEDASRLLESNKDSNLRQLISGKSDATSKQVGNTIMGAHENFIIQMSQERAKQNSKPKITVESNNK